MSHSPEATSLQRFVQLVRALGNEAVINPSENEGSVAFKRQVLSLLRKYEFDIASLNRPVTPDHDFTFLTVLLGNQQLPWNVQAVLSDWEDRYLDTGYDFVAAWCEAQSFRGC